MTTMQEALADRFLAAAEVPEFLAETNDLMQRSFQNPKYGNEGLRLSDSNNSNGTGRGTGGIPSKRQNKIRSGRAGRKAARSRQVLEAVGGLSYKGPWDAIKASDKPADYEMCRLKGDLNTGTKARVAGTSSATSRSTTSRAGSTNGKHRSSILAAVIAQHKADQNQAGAS